MKFHWTKLHLNRIFSIIFVVSVILETKDLHLIKNNYQNVLKQKQPKPSLHNKNTQAKVICTYVLLLTGHLSEGAMNSLFGTEHFSLESPHSQYIIFFLQL